jgi:thioredoxin-related protein
MLGWSVPFIFPSGVLTLFLGGAVPSQVDGCGVDLSGDDVKKYQQRNRVCEIHQKLMCVIVKGQNCRYCQQVRF